MREEHPGRRTAQGEAQRGDRRASAHDLSTHVLGRQALRERALEDVVGTPEERREPQQGRRRDDVVHDGQQTEQGRSADQHRRHLQVRPEPAVDARAEHHAQQRADTRRPDNDTVDLRAGTQTVATVDREEHLGHALQEKESHCRRGQHDYRWQPEQLPGAQPLAEEPVPASSLLPTLVDPRQPEADRAHRAERQRVDHERGRRADPGDEQAGQRRTGNVGDLPVDAEQRVRRFQFAVLHQPRHERALRDLGHRGQRRADDRDHADQGDAHHADGVEQRQQDDQDPAQRVVPPEQQSRLEPVEQSSRHRAAHQPRQAEAEQHDSQFGGARDREHEPRQGDRRECVTRAGDQHPEPEPAEPRVAPHQRQVVERLTHCGPPL
ncbi:hypothetical protein APASM_1615 [Actinosynnema pretiosum subsp. pretiosum]|nr:hypothetical protein APASM_1615 [Actinosynnema pretiosum subsp. pretiosum]